MIAVRERNQVDQPFNLIKFLFWQNLVEGTGGQGLEFVF